MTIAELRDALNKVDDEIAKTCTIKVWSEPAYMSEFALENVLTDIEYSETENVLVLYGWKE